MHCCRTQVPLARVRRTCSGRSRSSSACAIVAVLVAYRLPAAGRAPLAVGGRSRRSWSASRVVVLSQVFMFLVPRLVGVAALAGRSRRPSSHWPGCRSPSRRAVRRGVGAGPRERRPAGRTQPTWEVPHRRQNRAFAESDSPQLTHGWTPRRRLTGIVGPATTSRIDAAHRASSPPPASAGRLRNGRPAAGALPAHSGRVGHCGSAVGSAVAAAGSVASSGGAGRRRVRRDHLPGRLLDDVVRDGRRGFWGRGRGWRGERGRDGDCELGGNRGLGGDRGLGCDRGRLPPRRPPRVRRRRRARRRPRTRDGVGSGLRLDQGLRLDDGLRARRGPRPRPALRVRPRRRAT